MHDPAATRILIIDDDDGARRMMRRAFERRGYEVLDRADGASGLAAIAEHRPTIVLLDLRMPGELSGFDVARLAKADESLRDIPIVIVSASVHSNAREMTEVTGCEAFVEKPVDFAVLDRAMADLLDVS